MTFPRARLRVLIGVFWATLVGLQEGLAQQPAQKAVPSEISTQMPEVNSTNRSQNAENIETFRDLMQVSTLNNVLGRYRAAERVLRLALTLCEGVFGVEDPDCGDVLTRIAIELSNQERFSEADLLFQQAETVIKKASSPLDFPRFLTYRAMDHANRGALAPAWTLVQQANRQRQKIIQTVQNQNLPVRDLLDRTIADLAHGLYVQATVAFQKEDWKAAKLAAHLSRVLIRRSESAPDWWVAHPDELLGRVALAEGDLEEAQKRQKLSLDTKKLALGETRPTALSHLWLGSVLRATQQTEAVITESRQGLAILDRELSETLSDPIDITRLQSFLLTAYEQAQALGENPRSQAQKTALYEDMFQAVQLNKAGIAARSIAEMTVRLQTEDPTIASLIRDAQEAQRLRDLLRQRFGRSLVPSQGERDDISLNTLRQAVREAASTAEALDTRLIEAFPRYAQRVAPSPVSYEALKPFLKEAEALLFFAIGEEAGFVFSVDRTGVTPFPLAVTEDQVADRVLKLRKAFALTGGDLGYFDMSLAYETYQELLGPLVQHLPRKDHLILVPSGALLSLPFGLLIDQPPPRGEAYHQASWFGQRHALSVVPSVRALVSLRETPEAPKSHKPLVAFGNPTYRGSDAGLELLERYCVPDKPVPSALLAGLAPLPGTAREVQQVARALNASEADLFLGAAANEQDLRRQDLSIYRTVYFATHGLLPGELSCQAEPALALSPPTQTAITQASDGLLTASEVAGLKLDADLVVLSACNTGGASQISDETGAERLGGEALSGLARAFFYAGARSLLVSHWQVESDATVALMGRLFGQFRQQNFANIAQALRQAQGNLIRDPQKAHPFFWAAFTLVGDGG